MNSVYDLTRTNREPQNDRNSNFFRSGKSNSFARLFTVLLLASISIGVAISFNATTKGSGYQVYAEFDAVGGLPQGAPIEATGVRIGTVSQVLLNKAGQARVQMSIDEGIVLPQDSIIRVQSHGPGGNKIVRILPGKSETTIAAGQTFPDTESVGERPREI